MPCGISGRVVVDLEQELKLRFDAKLKADGITKHDWLTERVQAYVLGVEIAVQLPLDLPSSTARPRPRVAKADLAGSQPTPDLSVAKRK